MQYGALNDEGKGRHDRSIQGMQDARPKDSACLRSDAVNKKGTTCSNNDCAVWLQTALSALDVEELLCTNVCSKASLQISKSCQEPSISYGI